ncbi:hypothetical protein [Haloarcula sp. CBA1131]|nr:hypothetical protein [Haloarcula sp. CBA1131]
MQRPHIEWCHDKLGWFSRGITQDIEGTYRLRTVSHPTLGRYWT